MNPRDVDIIAITSYLRIETIASAYAAMSDYRDRVMDINGYELLQLLNISQSLIR